MYPNFAATQYPTVNWPMGQNNGFQTAMSMPSQQPMMQRPVLLGRVINSTEDIMANDVPTDGSSGFFPLADGSAIIKKTLNADWTTKTTKYIVEPEEPEEPKPSEIEELKEWLDERLKSLTPQPRFNNQQRNNKEVMKNEH